MKKGIRFVLVASCGLLLLNACGSDQKEKLVIYSPHGKELLGEFEKLYEAKYPNVDIQWLDMGSQEVFDRVSTESKNPQADLWWGAPSTMFMRAEKMGLLETYKPSWADKVPASAKSKTDAWYGTFSTPEVIAFNDKKLNENNVPQDWDDVVSSKWRNKVVLRNPTASGTLRAIFCGMIELSIEKTGDDNRGWAWLAALDSNIDSYSADPTQMYAKLGGENEAITLWNMPDIVLQKNKNKLPFGYLFPIGGTFVVTDAIAIVKGTKHKELAQNFYEFVTSEENLLVQSEKYYRIPTRTDIAKDKLPDWLKNCRYTVLDIDWEKVSEKEGEWMQRWDSEIKK